MHALYTQTHTCLVRNNVYFVSFTNTMYYFRLLKDTLHDVRYGVRYEHILGAFLSVCGRRLREELEKQARLVKILGMVAEKVKQTSGSARQVG